MQVIKGKLSIIDGNKVYWDGEAIKGVDSLILVSNKNGIQNVSLKIKDGDPTQIIALSAGGVNVRGVA